MCVYNIVQVAIDADDVGDLGRQEIKAIDPHEGYEDALPLHRTQQLQHGLSEECHSCWFFGHYQDLELEQHIQDQFVDVIQRLVEDHGIE